MAVGCYADSEFLVLWGHDNPYHPIFDNRKSVFVVKFSNYPLLYISNLHTYISLSTLNYEYTPLYNLVRDLINLNILTNNFH